MKASSIQQLTYGCGMPESLTDMRRFIALLIFCAGFLGAGSPALACATAAAAGDCCPPGAPSGCTQAYEQLDIEASICCFTAAAPSQLVAADRGHELQVVQLERRSADPIDAGAFAPVFAALRYPTHLDVPAVSASPTDASLTYLRTGRLRL